MPEPGSVFGYNRYMYAMGNPLKFNDPSGRCATFENGDPDETTENNADCWRLARSIANMWESTSYWQKRFGDISVWSDYIAPSSVDTEFMSNELIMFHNSEEGQLSHGFEIPQHDLDLGDYTAFSGSLGLLGYSIIRDDFGRIYVRLGLDIGTPGISLTRGEVLRIDDPNKVGLRNIISGDFAAIDIDEIGLSNEQKQDLMQSLMVGPSTNGSFNYMLFSFEASKSASSISIDNGIGGPNLGGNYSPYSYTWQLWPFGNQ